MTLAALLPLRSQVVIRAGIYADWAAAGVSVQGLQDTSILRAAGETVAQIEATAEVMRFAVTSGGYISGAEALTGDAAAWLDLLGEDFFQIPRDQATRTEGKFRVAALATASGSTIGTGKLLARYGIGATAVIYENAEGFTPILGSYVDVLMRAQIAGASGNIGNNATLALVTSYPGLTVTNPPIAGLTSWITKRGRGVEAQKPYGARLRTRWADLAPQTVAERAAALVRAAYVALGLPNPITRIYPDDTNPLGPGSFAIYLATDTAPASAEDVAIVQAYVAPRWAAGAGLFMAYAAFVHEIAVVGNIKGPSNSAAALTQASAALATLQVTYPIGGTKAYLEQRRSALLVGVTGAVNVTLTGTDESIPPGAIVEFTPITLSVVP